MIRRKWEAFTDWLWSVGDWLYIAFMLFIPLFSYFGGKIYYRRKANAANNPGGNPLCNRVAAASVLRAAGLRSDTITAEELRTKLSDKLNTLAGSWLVSRGDREILRAMRSWLPEMRTEDLDRIIALMGER